MGSSGGTQTPVTQQTQQTKDPWSAAQPHLINAMGSAQSLYGSNTGYQPWTGQTQAALDPFISNTMNTMYGQLLPDVNAGGTAGNIASRQLGTDLIQNQGLSPELRSLYEQAKGDENPYLQNIINTSNRQISDKVGSSMSGAGRYGSGQHTDVAARAMAEAADPLLAQDYARRQQQQQSILEGGQQRAGQWAQLMPGLDEARFAPAQSLMALGQFNQERAQGALQDQIKTYNAQQSYPWEQLARYNAIVGGAGGLGGSMTGSTTTPINSPSTLQKLLGGGLAGAGIGGSFGGPVGAGVGALGGGLLGMMG
jgi:hypothetical protein